MNIFFKAYCLFIKIYADILEHAVRLLIRRHAPKGIMREQNKIYGDLRYADMLDYYYRPGSGKKPVFIYIHGGGFISGTKSMRKYYCFRFVDKGFFAMNMNYRLSPEVHHPEHLQRIFKAIEMMLDEAQIYNLDLDNIVVAGESAGAYFTSFVAAASKDHTLYDQLGISFKYRDTFDVKGTVLISGLYDCRAGLDIHFLNIGTYIAAHVGLRGSKLKRELENMPELYSPIYHITPEFPPSCVISAKRDSLRIQSYAFSDELKKSGVKHLDYMTSGWGSYHASAIAITSRMGQRCLKITQKFIFDNALSPEYLEYFNNSNVD